MAENTSAEESIGGPVTAADPDSGDTLVYSLSGVDAGSFDIEAATGQLKTRAALDYESRNSYQVTVEVSDGILTDTIGVTINVTDAEEQPALSGSPAVSYAENGTAPVAGYTAADPEGATVRWSLSGDDADDFSISAGGLLSFNASPDFEDAQDADTTNTYQVTVEATDGTTDKVTLAVTITVTNEEELGVVALSPAQPVVGTAMTATLIDPDGSITATTWQWASSTDGSDGLDGHQRSGIGELHAGSGRCGKYLRATATYTDGEGAGKSAQGVSANTVMAAAPVNQAPAFADDTADLEVGGEHLCWGEHRWAGDGGGPGQRGYAGLLPIGGGCRLLRYRSGDRATEDPSCPGLRVPRTAIRWRWRSATATSPTPSGSPST